MDLWTILFIGAAIYIAIIIVRHSIDVRRRKRAEQERLRLLAERRAYLLQKYGDEAVVEAIMEGNVWQGMSHDQLVDSLGHPADKAVRVFKSKTVETFKYGEVGKGRYATRVRVENGQVVGWETK